MGPTNGAVTATQFVEIVAQQGDLLGQQPGLVLHASQLPAHVDADHEQEQGGPARSAGPAG